MVKKLEKGSTVTCYKCHEGGHEFYKCPQFVKKMDKGEKKKINPTIKTLREKLTLVMGIDCLWLRAKLPLPIKCYK
jgi:hypothetical protein